MKKAIVTGSCGFIGTCLCKRLLAEGVEVVGIDNLSRKGSEFNAAELEHERFELVRIDLSHIAKVGELFATVGPVDAVFHLAAQVAVTVSYAERVKDFFDNAVASFAVVEGVKRFSPGAYCLYASTNKVYGCGAVERPVGVGFGIDPYTPYGVSKATGELYFTEYGRPEIGLSTCSLRQSCVYGHHQFGIEDQGWMAWFAIANLLELPVTIYGDGAQIRDLLFVDDLIDLYLTCAQQKITGAMPVGGGEGNSIAIRTGLELVSNKTGKAFRQVRQEKARPGDQRYFVADLSWVPERNIDWRPRVRISEGLDRMIEWIEINRKRISSLFGV